MREIFKCEAVSVSTTAKEIECQHMGFMLANPTADKTVYFCSADNGEKATAAKSFPVPPGTVLDTVFSAGKISVIASEAGADLRILFID